MQTTFDAIFNNSITLSKYKFTSLKITHCYFVTLSNSFTLSPVCKVKAFVLSAGVLAFSWSVWDRKQEVVLADTQTVYKPHKYNCSTYKPAHTYKHKQMLPGSLFRGCRRMLRAWWDSRGEEGRERDTPSMIRMCCMPSVTGRGGTA